jgi:hypothetical protein
MGTEKIKRVPQTPKERVRKPYVKKACIPCKSAHTACDSTRPCKRCVTLGIESECVDVERKKPIARKPRKKKNKEAQQFYPSMQEYLPYITPYNKIQMQMGNQIQLGPNQQFYPQYGYLPYTTNPNIILQPQDMGYYSIEGNNNMEPQQFINKEPLLQIQLTPNNTETETETTNEEMPLKKEEEEYDMFMDLTNFSPSTSSPTQNYLNIELPEEKKDESLKVLEKNDDEYFDDTILLDVPKANDKILEEEIIDSKELQVIPFQKSNKNNLNKQIESNMTNTQLQEMLHMVWETQQSQSQEIQNLKDIVNDLKNLLISKNKHD